jgi:integrase
MHIEKRKNRSGKISYRARIVRQGYPLLTKTFPTKAEAERWGKQREADLVSARWETPQSFNKTVAELIDRFRQDRPSGRGNWLFDPGKGSVLDFWKEHLGDAPLAQLRTSTIAQARDWLFRNPSPPRKKYGFQKPRQPATCNRYVAALSSVIQYGVEIGWCEHNPCRGLRRLKEDNARVRRLNPEERVKLLEACQADTDLLHIVQLALLTGARRGELQNMRWKDVDLNEALLVFPHTKNGDVRVIPLAPEAAGILKERFRNRTIGPIDWVFPAPKCEGHADFTHRFLRAVRHSGVEDFHFHDLRHTAASEMASAGLSDRTIGEVLGHRTVQMVRRYSHLRPTDLREAVSVLGTSLNETRPYESTRS